MLFSHHGARHSGSLTRTKTFQTLALYLFKFYDFPPLNEVQKLQPCCKEFRFVFWLVDFSVRKYESFLHRWVKPLVLRKCGRRHSLILRTKTPTKATESSHALNDEWSVVVLSKPVPPQSFPLLFYNINC